MLIGNVLKVIDGFEVIGVNYEVVVECFKYRYGRKCMIILFLVKFVIKMDVKLVVNVFFFRDFYDIFMNRIRVLEVFGEDLMSYGCILLFFFEIKLLF